LLQSSVSHQTVDSLERELNVAEGRSKVIVLNELCKQYINNNPTKALSYTRQALVLAEKINDRAGEASSYNNIGVIFKNQGSLDKALDNYISALRIQDKNNFEDALANTYNNIGTVYSLKEDYEKALDYFNQAYEQFYKIDNKRRIIGALNNIGNVYEAMSRYDEALDYYLQSLRLYEELADHNQTFVPFNNIGNIYFRQGDMASAMAYYQSALDLEKFNNDLNGQANALHNIGSVLKANRDFEEAINHFNTALDAAQETDNKRILAIIYRSLSETYFAQENMFMAYSFLSLHAAAKDSLHKEENSKRIANLETAYELEKKASEIETLKVESRLQQLEIKNDRIIISAIIIVSVIGIGLTVVIYRENKVIKKNEHQLNIQKRHLEKKNKIIEQRNRTVTESIDYAKSVQQSLQDFKLPIDKASRSFVFYKPKDIVSGDFYWYADKGDVDIIAAADCTGHGVAGAFMTVVGMTALENIVGREDVTAPSEILKQLNESMSIALQRSNKDVADHGLDIGLCTVDHKAHTVTFAGANRPLFYITEGDLKQIKGTKRNIGDGIDTHLNYKETVINFKPGDVFYLTTDGYVDQFGGALDKKFMLRRFRQLLLAAYSKPFAEQQQIVASEFEKWKKDQEQTDDVLVIGFKP
ncbi:tetratricopeptide repeat protein, partial [Fulvivirga sp. RKSG066]|uniref:tetratricopeptide repeat protein n=1 Tax=Fulvivirga aurantia TaxID=2529383 RepID=UPI0012BC70F4